MYRLHILHVDYSILVPTVHLYEGDFRLGFCYPGNTWDDVSEYVMGYYRNNYVSCECQVGVPSLHITNNTHRKVEYCSTIL